jgi:hypothetical protein
VWRFPARTGAVGYPGLYHALRVFRGRREVMKKVVYIARCMIRYPQRRYFMEILIILGVLFFLCFVVHIANTFSENANLHKSVTALRTNLEEKIKSLNQAEKENIELNKQAASQEKWRDEKTGIKNQLLDEINSNLKERTDTYKWLSPLIADIKLLAEDRLRDDSDFLKNGRKFNLLTADAKKRKINELTGENNFLRYNLEYVKTFVPGIEDIIDGDTIEDKANNEELKKEDNPKKFIKKDEYNLLTDREKNERAFENYKNRKQSNWEIGRDYEMYIGHLCELDGWEVEYFGIEKKLEDLGRDLIAKKGNETLIIQCKRWAKNKIIREKHIAQLFGTVAIYKFENPKEKNVTGIFITTAGLSEEAKKFARFLNIGIFENVKMGEYPMIKCHHGRGDEHGFRKKIYHLPVDQQYDGTIINKNHHDCYAFTVEEAEEKGFERAHRWRSNWGDYS